MRGAPSGALLSCPKTLLGRYVEMPDTAVLERALMSLEFKFSAKGVKREDGRTAAEIEALIAAGEPID